MNYLDLFSGIGGFALGAHWAGMKFDNHYFSEIEKFPIELYKKRFPDAIALGDITKINCDELPKGEWIITGGFPCQDISCAGKGVGIEGKRSGLWFTYADIISKLRPRFAIMENVGALTIRGLDAVLGSLAQIGYDAEWQDIRAEDMGAPHRRERIWIVAYPNAGQLYTQRKGFGKKNKIEKTNRLTRCSQNEMADTDKIMGRGERGGQWGSRDVKETFSTSKDIKNNWSTEPDVGRLAHGISNRVDRLKGLGNAIVPQIAELLFNQIKNYV